MSQRVTDLSRSSEKFPDVIVDRQITLFDVSVDHGNVVDKATFLFPSDLASDNSNSNSK